MPALKTPILFLVFNRPAETARVFEAIREQQPRRLFVAADGARTDRPGELGLMQETRTIATQVDWPCEVKTLFRDTNLGCGLAVSGAISWFFEQVEEGIILEDDCLPHPDFFPYCETLLARYRHELRIATIAGTHFLPGSLPHEHSHYVSKYFQMWGWATWRRTWKLYDYDLSKLSVNGCTELLQATHPITVECKYWTEIYHALKVGAIDTWDFQVFFSSWRTGANHVMPGRNLVSNIGYGPAATHTNFASSMAEIPTQPLTVGAESVPLEPDPIVDNLIFYLRFLESLTHTYWLEQVISPEHRLGAIRNELVRRNRLIRQLELEVQEKRRQLLAATQALARAEDDRVSV
jgi:hypothetical protein